MVVYLVIFAANGSGPESSDVLEVAPRPLLNEDAVRSGTRVVVANGGGQPSVHVYGEPEDSQSVDEDEEGGPPREHHVVGLHGQLISFLVSYLWVFERHVDANLQKCVWLIAKERSKYVTAQALF